MPDYNITVVVPDEAEAKGSATHADVCDGVRERLADVCGGFTVREGDGGWVDGDGNLISEPVREFTAVGEFRSATAARAFARGVADFVKFATTEDAVLATASETHKIMV